MNMLLILAASVTLTWDVSPDAVNYRMYVGIQSLIEGNPPVMKFDVAGPPHKVDGLDIGTKYYFAVTALNGIGESGFSNQIEYTPLLPATSPNFILNPGFEIDNRSVQDPQNWEEWSNKSKTYGYTSNTTSAHSGDWFYIQWAPQAFQFYTWQFVRGLPNGIYDLKAWVICSENLKSCLMEVKDNGGPKTQANIAAIDGWTQVSISGINVSNGQCVVAFWIDASGGGQWLAIDDVELSLRQ
jgi:hypothetical protein